MDAHGLLTAFTLLACLGSGLFFWQGVQACRYQSERLNRPAALVALVAVLAGAGCFVARLGHWDRVFGMFSNVSSPTTLLLYAVVLFAVGAVVFLAVSLRSEDGSVPRWCGVLAMAVSVALVGLLGFANYNYLHLSTLTPDFWALTGYYAANALALGALAELALGAALGCDDTAGFASKAALPCVLLSAIGMAAVLWVFSLDSQAASTATTSMFSMAKYNVKAASTVTAADTLAVVLSGASAPLFWGGAVAVGAAVPLAVSAAVFFGKGGKRPVVLATVALVCAIVGAVCFRACLRIVGI